VAVGAHDPIALLGEELDASPAIGWLKDVGGRYVRINPRYAQQLGTTDERMLGRSDAELTARETIDGPRLAHSDGVNDEPVQLEYTVEAFEGRPALAALRFVVRDASDEAVGVCGVAAELGEAQLARSECTRLMSIERSWRSDPGPEHVNGHSAISNGEASAELVAARSEAAEAAAQLREERHRIAGLQEASAAAAARAEELGRELATERGVRAELERGVTEARRSGAHGLDAAATLPGGSGARAGPQAGAHPRRDHAAVLELLTSPEETVDEQLAMLAMSIEAVTLQLAQLRRLLRQRAQPDQPLGGG
jgi:pyruvate/2-oxoglutarate dehydrogenase complex dihydrolipoamide acyltransferase (E2) component